MKKAVTLAAVLLGMILSVSVYGQEENTVNIEEVYRKGFSQYLVEALDLTEYDRELKESDLEFLPTVPEEQTEAQKSDEMGLEYFYLRNELHTERLTPEQTAILEKEGFQKEGSEFSEEAMQVILTTFPEVITPKKIETEEDKKVQTTYDFTMAPNFVTMDSLVLMIGTSREYDAQGNYVDYDHELEKTEALREFARQMEEELAGALGDVPIRVFLDVNAV